MTTVPYTLSSQHRAVALRSRGNCFIHRKNRPRPCLETTFLLVFNPSTFPNYDPDNKTAADRQGPQANSYGDQSSAGRQAGTPSPSAFKGGDYHLSQLASCRERSEAGSNTSPIVEMMCSMLDVEELRQEGSVVFLRLPSQRLTAGVVPGCLPGTAVPCERSDRFSNITCYLLDDVNRRHVGRSVGFLPLPSMSA